MIKEKSKTVIRHLMGNEFLWKIARHFIRLARRLGIERYYIAEHRLRHFFNDLTVRNGPFKGMKYPEFVSHGSWLFAKLLGTYENELEDIIEHVCRQRYKQVIDVGCAEGYYAIGCAMRMPYATIHAFDSNPEAIKACMGMAIINGVDERVITYGACDAEVLSKFQFDGKGLIICDCEGYEIELFKEKVVNQLRDCDLLIELHDCINPTISKTILERFSKTHRPTLIKSEKRQPEKYKKYKELAAMYSAEKELAINEGRGPIMEWVFLEPK